MKENKPKTKAEQLAARLEAQRVAQSAFEAGKQPVNETQHQEPVKPAQEAAEPQKEEQMVAVPSEPEKAAEKPTMTENSITKSVIKEISKKKSAKGTYALYLSDENMEKADRIAKKTKQSKSEIIDQILSSGILDELLEALSK